MVIPFEKALNQIAENTKATSVQMVGLTDAVNKLYGTEKKENVRESKEKIDKERKEADRAGKKKEEGDKDIKSKLDEIIELLEKDKKGNFGGLGGGLLGGLGSLLGNLTKGLIAAVTGALSGITKAVAGAVTGALGKGFATTLAAAIGKVLVAGAAPVALAGGVGAGVRNLQAQSVYGGGEAGEYGLQVQDEIMDLNKKNLRSGGKGGARANSGNTNVNLTEEEKERFKRLKEIQQDIKDSTTQRDEELRNATTTTGSGRSKKRTIDPEVEEKIKAEHQERVKKIKEDNKDLFPVEPTQVQGYQKGGSVYNVPGNTTGDNHNMMVPAGSFVLNRNASSFLDNMPLGFQKGGMVPIKTESGEKVFSKDKVTPDIITLNNIIPRFQEGGNVEGQETSNDKPENDTTEEPTITQGQERKEGEGGAEAVISAGKSLLSRGFTVAEHPNFEKHVGYKEKGDARVGGHSPGSLHYKNLAIDVTDWRDGDWKGRTKNLAEEMYERKDELKITQIIHDPWGSWFGGSKGGAIGGHGTHLHLGFAKGLVGDDGKLDETSPEDQAETEKGAGNIFQSAMDGIGNVTSFMNNLLGFNPLDVGWSSRIH